MNKEIAHYPVFINKKKDELVFYPVKKNANSSAKLFFAKHLGIENNYFFLEDEKPRHLITKLDYRRFGDKLNLMQFFVNNSKFKKVDTKYKYKACIVRNPLSRFVSAYKNRVLFHKDKEFFEHSIDLVIEKLENGLFENKHFIQQNYFLGNNLNYYNIVGNLSNIDPFVEKINIFFDQKINFPRIQTGGKGNKITLNLSQKSKIKKIYKDDYILYEHQIMAKK